jgi:alanine racemase
MTQTRTPSSWCEIHRDRISRNLDIALDLVPQGRQFCAVLKADAYGHGIQHVTPLVMAKGITVIGITSNAEARAVREAGFKGTVIRVRAASFEELESAVAYKVEEQVGSLEAARALLALKDTGHGVRCHLALNAEGMSRDGLEIATEGGRGKCRKILELLSEDIVGICTHYPSNEPDHLRESADLFQQQVAWVFENSALQRDRVTVHAGSSLTLVSSVPTQTDMYRCGALMYGVLKPDLGFVTTMDLKAHVVSLGDYPKGITVGYDKARKLEADRRLACISIGYANGISRMSQDRGVVSIGSGLAPIMGKISMNTLVADVTALPEVSVGDVVTIFGGHPPTVIDPDMAVEQFGTILADLYSDWGMRNDRRYF